MADEPIKPVPPVSAIPPQAGVVPPPSEVLRGPNDIPAVETTPPNPNSDLRLYESASYSPSPTLYTAPSPDYAGVNLGNDLGDDLVDEMLPNTSPADGTLPPSTTIPSTPSASDDIISSGSGVIGEPNADNAEKIKGQENELFKKLEQLITDDNIEQFGQMLKAYGNVEIPTDKLKKVLPKLMPVLTKYGNRFAGGGGAPEKFAKYSAEASKFAELAKDVQPLLGSLIETLMEPATDAQGNVVLKPEDEQNFDKMAEESADDENLSDFLKDDTADGGQQQQQQKPADALPDDLQPKRMSYDGRGGRGATAVYSAPSPTIPQKNPIFESLDDLQARQRDELGAENFDAGMAAARRREDDMKARPYLETYEDSMRQARQREEDLRRRPALEPQADAAKMARDADLMSRPALQQSQAVDLNAQMRAKDLNSRPALQKKKSVEQSLEDGDIDMDDFFRDEENKPDN